MQNIYRKVVSLNLSIKLCVLGLLGVFIYVPLFNAYFQQDEWFAFGHYFSISQEGLVGMLRNAFAPNIGHFTPLYYLSFYGLMSIFGPDYQSFLFVSILSHIIIYFFLFLLTRYLTKDNYIALLTSALFLFASAAHQATSWVVADTNTHGASFFGILSLLFGVKFIRSDKRKYLFTSILFVYVSLFFKEVTVGLFPSLLFLIVFFGHKKKLISSGTIISFLSAVSYVLLRAGMFLLPQSTNSASLVTQSQTLSLLLYNIVSFPGKAFFQSLFPQQVLIFFGRIIGRILPHAWPSNTLQFSNYVNEKILEPMFFVSFIFVCIFTYKRFQRDKSEANRLMIFGLIFVCCNSIIYAFSPERTGVITFIDSRNLYFVTIGTALWFSGVVISRLKQANLIACGVVISYFLFQGIGYATEFPKLIQQGTIRKVILMQIHKKVNDLPKNSIFYITSDTPYYGLSDENATPPFQSGLGHTLLVTYTNDQYYPKSFYSDTFLWPLTSQGYLSENGFGYGYFRNYDQLLNTVKSQKFPLDQVYAFSWRGDTESIVDITNQTRENLSTDISK